MKFIDSSKVWREGVAAAVIVACGLGTFRSVLPMPVAAYARAIARSKSYCRASAMRRARSRSVLSDVAAAMAAGRLHPERITTRRATWKDAREAMAEPGVKLVVER